MGGMPQGPGAIVVGGKTIACQRDGDGRTLLFVHGMISDHGIWDSHVAAISSRYHMIRPTLSYFGSLPWPDDGKGFAVDRFADELGAFITSCELEAPTLVGWSFGGGVCLSLASRMPQLVGDMILYEPSLLASLTDPEKIRAALESRDEMFRLARSNYSSGDHARATAAFIDGVNGRKDSFANLPETVRNVHLRNARSMGPFFSDPPPPSITPEDLNAIAQRVVLLLGQETPTFWQLSVPALAELLPNAELRRIANASHMWPVESPDGFVEELLSGLG
jgi:pimeloyl-ACP methyl ester carboxylesterase